LLLLLHYLLQNLVNSDNNSCSVPNKLATMYWKRFQPHPNSVCTLPCETQVINNFFGENSYNEELPPSQ